MGLQETQNHYKYFLKSWFLFDYCMPVILIFSFWPISVYFLNIPFAFEKIFSSADLMPVGSLLMLSVAREIESEQRLNRISSGLDNYRLLGLFMPVIILFVYSLFKYQSITYVFPTNPQSTVNQVVEFSAYLSFAIIFFSGCFCFFAKWKIISSLCEQDD